MTLANHWKRKPEPAQPKPQRVGLLFFKWEQAWHPWHQSAYWVDTLHGFADAIGCPKRYAAITFEEYRHSLIDIVRIELDQLIAGHSDWDYRDEDVERVHELGLVLGMPNPTDTGDPQKTLVYAVELTTNCKRVLAGMEPV